MNRIKVEKQIKQVIKEHCGWELWSIRPDLEYNVAIAPFVASLVEILRSEITKSKLKYIGTKHSIAGVKE